MFLWSGVASHGRVVVEQLRLTGHRWKVLLCDSELAMILIRGKVARQLSKDWNQEVVCTLQRHFILVQRS